jgi:hypothetical protein
VSAPVFLFCTGLLALWSDVRIGETRPESLRSRAIHAGVAFAAIELAIVGANLVAPEGAAPAQQLTAVFALLLPAMVYALVASLWLLRSLAGVSMRSR